MGVANVFIEEALGWLSDDIVSGDTDVQAAPGTVGAAILLADDNADVRRYVKGLLAPYWSVEAVGDGESALARARAHQPDLILTDVMMPGLDGFGLLKALRADARTATIPVILISARAGEESRVEGLDAGADDYLVKPFTTRELIARVNAHLTLARLRRQTEQALEDFFENSVLALHWVGPGGTILRANRAELELLGVTREELIGRNIAEFHADADVIADIMRRLAAREEIHNYPARLRRKDGTIKHVLISSNVLWDGDRFVHTGASLAT